MMPLGAWARLVTRLALARRSVDAALLNMIDYLFCYISLNLLMMGWDGMVRDE